MSERADIANRADCERLIRAFYGRAMSDPILGFLFVDAARLDLESHVPRITDFWETILLGAQRYSGGAFRPHAELNAKAPLRPGHFERWLHLRRTPVDELFTGPTADLVLCRAPQVQPALEVAGAQRRLGV